MDKGGYNKMNIMFNSVDWQRDTGDSDIEQQWTLFRYRYDEAMETCVLRYEVKPAGWRKLNSMNARALKLM